MSDDQPLCVRRFHEGGYLVRSQRPECPNRYLVVTDDPAHPHGRCECDDYNIRIEPFVRRGETPERYTCVHIDAVLAELDHARQLCEAAGLQFSERIIPMI